MAITAAELMVTVGADTAGAERGLQSIGDRLDNLGRGLGTAGMGLTGAITAPVLGIGAAIGKVGIDFETAFTGVIKTVDASESQIAGLREGILGMARELPASASEIAAVAESAGQLGIATGSILDFTRTMIDLGETTNLSSEMAASQLARLANITGMPQTEFDRLGSTIVALGNNLATTEADIVSMAMRIAGAGSQVGMTEAEILSFAGALSSVGIEAEAGGSAISRVFIDMANAAATGGADLEAFASVAGMSAEEFATAFQSDAAGAAISFIQGLNGISESGGNVFAVLEDLGLSEIRVRDALLRASGASGLFTDALALGSEAWIENTALTNEAALRYGTTESRLDTLRNRVTELGISLSDKAAPAFDLVIERAGGLIDKAGELIEWFGTLNPDTMNLALAIGAVAAATGPVLLGLAGVAMALSFLISPIGLVLVALGALAAAWATDFGGMRTAVTEWWQDSQPALDEAKTWFAETGTRALEDFQAGWEELTEFLSPATDRLGESFSGMMEKFADSDGRFDKLSEAFNRLGVAAEPLKELIGVTLAGAIDTALNLLSSWLDKLPEAVDTAIEMVTNTIDTVAGVLESATKAVQAIMEGDWDTAWKAGKEIVSTALGGMLQQIELSGNLFGLALGGLKDTIVNTLADFGVDVKNPLDEVERSVREFWAWLTGLSWDPIADSLSGLFQSMLDEIELTISGFKWNDFIPSLTWSIPPISWSSFIPRVNWPSISISDIMAAVREAIERWLFGGGANSSSNNAVGSSNFGGGLTWVGERGPELVALPGGSRIYNHQESMALAGGGGVTVQIMGPVHVAGDMDIEMLALRVGQAIQRRGGR